MSTANDIAKWMNFHLKEGRDGNGRRVMAADQVKEVHKPRMLITSLTSSHELRQPQFPVTSTLNTYAHGLRRGFYRGKHSIRVSQGMDVVVFFHALL